MKRAAQAMGLAILGLATAGADAGTLRGTLQPPPEETRPAVERPLAYYRIESGLLPIAPPERAEEAVLVLVPRDRPAAPPPEAHVTVEARGLRLWPRLLVAPAGVTVDFKNLDPRPRVLRLKDGDNFMPAQPTAPGEIRSLPFSVAGEYIILDDQPPYAHATLLIVPSPYFSRSDEKGGFQIDAPDGSYTLQVYHRGRWAVTLPVSVGSGGPLTIPVPAAAAAPGTGG